MKLASLMLAVVLTASCTGAGSSYPVVSFQTPADKKLEITMIHHGSIAMKYRGFEIQVDPVGNNHGQEIDYSSFDTADLILITHEHGDHLDPETIDYLSSEDTRLILNSASQQQIGKGETMINGNTQEINDNIFIHAVPAYNITDGRTMFHPQGNGNGYVISFDGFVVYVSGDTENIEEMADFEEMGAPDVAFLSANQPYTMTVEQCIAAALTINPKVLIPYHLSDTDVEAIKEGVQKVKPEMEVLLFEELR